MKNIIISILLFSYCPHAFSQERIKLEDVQKHIGDSVYVCGKVFSARYFESSSGTPTLLNLGAPYPNQLLTLVIYGDVRKNFIDAPEIAFRDKVVCVRGKIVLFKEKPQIILYKKDQISEPVH